MSKARATGRNDEIGGIDYGRYCRLVDASLSIERRSQFFQWCRDELQAFLPHGVLIGIAGDLGRLNFRTECFFEYGASLPGGHENGKQLKAFLAALLKCWRCNDQAPLIFSAEGGGCDSCGFGEDELAPQGFSDCSAHGIAGPDHGYGTFFLFLGGLAEESQRRARRLALIVPHLYATLNRVSRAERQAGEALAKGKRLSAREIEIMRWVGAGKTNQEIANILNLSPYTVKNHLQKILRKLNVANRAQASAKLGRASSTERRSSLRVLSS
ncbi:MAG TPA: LuxR C-terminal-related transcriptional regulator [Candidatus Desulfobacillus sp.]|nr:LuxR C-terminal-related transcriptional regulator [Candidatus Desulfobacillus sp.]